MKPSFIIILVVPLIALMLIITSVVVIVLVWPTPTPQIDESELVGKYVGEYLMFLKITDGDRKGIYENSKLSLELRSDGTYVYQRTKIDGAQFTNSGTWEFEYWEGKPIISFSGFDFALPRYSRKRGFWVTNVGRTRGGNIKLCIDPDGNYFFVKQKP